MHEERQGWHVAALAIAATLVCAPADAETGAPSNGVADVVVHALALLGTPYRDGGNSPAAGFDCSGLVRYVFAEALRRDLPRRAEDMERAGEPVARSELQPGDLVFFNTLQRPFSHVAIYIGDGRFVHAPARKGVTRLESIDDRYWRVRFDGARRIAGPQRSRPHDVVSKAVESDAHPDARRPPGP
jgi:cell wall-associated NlpC family hydrolase